MKVVFRLVSLIAFLLMPLGMGGAAMAAPVAGKAAAHHAMAVADHCAPDKKGDSHSAPAPSMDCTAACTALPATYTAPLGEVLLRPALPRDLREFSPLHETVPRNSNAAAEDELIPSRTDRILIHGETR